MQTLDSGRTDVTLRRGKDGGSGPSWRCRGDFCTSLQLACAEGLSRGFLVWGGGQPCCQPALMEASSG